jgi:hypothetical protein
MKKCTVTYDDVAFWAENAAHAHKFIIVKKQCEKLMGSTTRKPTAEIVSEFGRRYNIIWNTDDSFDLIPV